MEVAIGGNGTTPFQREVREWQHVDPNTGALLTGRLEADRWVNGPSNAYGKVVDSKNVSQPNGTQHTQRKQFEVLQARTSSGSLQVVRAQTVHKSSSRWSSDVRSIASGNHSSNQTFANGITNGHHSPIENGYEDNRIENTPSFKVTQRISQNSSPIIPPTSFKLSTLIKNDEKNNAHSLASSALLLQHQQFINERKQNLLTLRPEAGFDEKRTFEETFGGATQNMTDSGISVNFHVRGKSVSIDDLSIEREQNDDDPDSPSEWRRVSKIRRSFQFPKSTSPRPSPQRPADLPENSVSVSRLREELENGRRLNTAMRGNTVDLVALDNILNGSVSNEGEDKTEAKPIKKATFLTAESLKEIRGKLRKLSDESLYKDDFLVGNRASESEMNQQCRDANDLLVQNETITQSNEYSIQQPVVLQDSQIVLQKPNFLRRDKPPESSVYNTNSLEGRSKYRDLSSAEWHLRRKSYGFEKMAPSTNSMFRMETSTDSGIGRSSELASWSLSEAQAKTVIMFGDNETTKSTLTFLPGNSTDNTRSNFSSFSSARQFFDSPNKNEMKEVKRHSIAVDESKYVRDNLKEVFDTKTSIHLNGLYNKDLNLSQASISDENGKRTKRVEFCKTEVHFVADSGRVNIVETDGKPPPTNNFRRRRRTANSVATSAYLQAINSGIPVTHFGDDQKPSFENETKGSVDTTFGKIKKSNVTVSTPLTTVEPVSIPKSILHEEEEDQSVSEEISLRGILKNKPVKPKPYHLGENIESSESLWGVRLKPVSSKTVGTKEAVESDDAADIPSKESSPPGAISIPSVNKYAADKMGNLEQTKASSNYLTKVKLNTTDSWESPELNESNVLSIEFNSPPSSLKRTSTGIKSSPHDTVPMARPRNLSPGVSATAVYKAQVENHDLKSKIHVHSSDDHSHGTKTPLKVGTGGARKLRDHELSYFGVKVSHNQQEVKVEDRKRSTKEAHRIVVANKIDPVVKQHYKLVSDKPDLLSHSLEDETRRSKNYHAPDEQTEQEHIYENIDECSAPYIRKSDLERDQRNLNEMAREAKLSLKPLKEKRIRKSESSKSSSFKPHKPLDTINEKTSSRSHSQHNSSKEHSRTYDKSSKQGSTTSPYSTHESIQRPCRMNRTPSASSNESLSRSPLSRHSHRRRSSEEREERSEVRAVKKPSGIVRECTKLRQRSSSRDSRTNASSSEDTAAKEIHDHLRKVRRTKQKETTKPVEKCEPKLQQSRQAIVTSTARSSAEPEERRRIRNAMVHSGSSHHTTDREKSSRKTTDKGERKERSSSTTRSRSSSTATDAPKSRTKSSRDVQTTSRSSKTSSTRR